jgi:hypothetical protein
VGSKSKSKGNGYELKVSKFLSELFGLSFCRIPNSGAFVGGKNAHRKESLTKNQILLMRGDILVPECFPNYILECKFYKEFSFHQLFDPEYNIVLLDRWITEVEYDSQGKDDKWMLFIKINRKGEYVVFDKDKWEFLNQSFHCYKERYIFAEKDSLFSKYTEFFRQKLII